MSTLHLVLIPHRPQAFSIGSLARASLFSLGCLGFEPAAAQEQDDLSHLVFEPVAIQVSETEDGERRIDELSSLPAQGERRRLEDLLAELAAEESPAAPTPEEDIARYEQSIRALERQGGAYEARLMQELLGLGTAWQQLGEHQQAIEVFERAWHVSRVNHGLFSLEQAPIIQKVIDSYLAAGDLAAADAQQEYLFFIQQRAHGADSPELLPALTALADWNIFAFNVRLDGDAYGSYSAQSNFQPVHSGTALGDEGFLTRRLVNAQNLYRAVIQIILSHAGVRDPRLLDVEKKLALTNYFFATNYNITSGSYTSSGSGLSMQSIQPTAFDSNFLSGNSMGYRHGRDALERRVEYLREFPDIDPAMLARAIVDLGDWLLIFRKRTSAVDTYDDAQALLGEAAFVQARRELFAPDVPVALPTFIHHNYSRGARRIPEDVALRYKGHIDVAFTLNRYGQPGDVEVLGKSASAGETIEGRLVRQVRRSVFRPRFDTDGETREDRVTLRYYFTW